MARIIPIRPPIAAPRPVIAGVGFKNRRVGTGVLTAPSIILLGAGSVNVPASGFDFYVSPTGSGSAAAGGTVANPWAIATLDNSTAKARYRGKIVGLLPGTYNIHAGMQGGYYETPYLNFDGGTISSPTEIIGVDPNPLNTVVTAKLSGVYGDSSSGRAAMGHNPDVGGTTQTGYVTIANFTLSGTGQRGIQMGRATGHGVPRFPGMTVRGMYFVDNDSGAYSDNSSVINLGSCVGALVEENFFYQNYGPEGPQNGDHWSAVLAWAGRECVIRKNSMVDSGNILFKNDKQVGNVVAQNFLDLTGWTQASGIQCMQGPKDASDPSIKSEIYNNIIICDNPLDLRGFTGEYWASPFEVHHNTLIAPGSSSFSTLGFAAYANAGTLKWHNNIIVATGVGFRGYVCVDAQAPDLMNYNMYPAAFYCTFLSQGGGSGATITGYNTLPLWRAAQPAASTGKEAQSEIAVPTFTGSGARALALQLTSGSAGKTTGTTDGTTSGGVTEKGGWGNGVTQIGHGWE